MSESLPSLSTLLTRLEGDLLAFAPRLLLAILVLGGTFPLATYLRRLSLNASQRLLHSQAAQGQAQRERLSGNLSLAVYVLTLVVGLHTVLELLGLAGVLIKLIASAGVAGIVLGFALKEIASNFFSSFLIHTQQPFREGDWVELGGNYGRVREINSMFTVLRTQEGQDIFIPNGSVYSENLINYSVVGKRRVVLAAGVSYGDDLEKVRRVALQEARQVQDVLLDDAHAPDFYFTGIGASTYNFDLHFWIPFKENTDYRRAMSEIITRIKARFEQEDISLAYNVTTLDFGVKGGVNLFDRAIQVEQPATENTDPSKSG